MFSKCASAIKFRSCRNSSISLLCVCAFGVAFDENNNVRYLLQNRKKATATAQTHCVEMWNNGILSNEN